MPRPSSIRLRLARLLGNTLERFEHKLTKDPAYVPSEAESRIMVNLAKADALVQGRSPVEGEDEDAPGKKADPAKAAELVGRIRSELTQNPTAPRVEGTDDDEP